MKTGDPIVFVVEDDSSMREALTDLITSVGLLVEPFKSAREFLEHRRRDAPACLVLDVRLPGLSGLDLQRELVSYGSANSDHIHYRPWGYPDVGPSH